MNALIASYNDDVGEEICGEWDVRRNGEARIRMMDPFTIIYCLLNSTIRGVQGVPIRIQKHIVDIKAADASALAVYVTLRLASIAAVILQKQQTVAFTDCHGGRAQITVYGREGATAKPKYSEKCTKQIFILPCTVEATIHEVGCIPPITSMCINEHIWDCMCHICVIYRDTNYNI